MSKVIFTVQYEINQQKREDYLISIRELKSLMKAEGLESYSVYELKGKSNHFEEIFIFLSKDAYDNYDDNENERVGLLLNKIEEMKIANSTKYNTLIEVE
jgi:hypothetical protein